MSKYTEGGYFHVRGWLDSPIWGGAPYSEREAWSWMIGEAAYKDCEVPDPNTAAPVKIYRGQFTASLRFMADKWGWSTGGASGKDRVRRFLKKLERWGSITIATATATDGATGQNVITICNYNDYQYSIKPPATGGATPSATGARHPRDKQEQIKQIKQKEKEIPNPSPPEDGKDYWFKGDVIRLNRQDFENWRDHWQFSDDGLQTYLESRDEWLSKQAEHVRKQWFISTKRDLDRIAKGGRT